MRLALLVLVLASGCYATESTLTLTSMRHQPDAWTEHHRGSCAENSKPRPDATITYCHQEEALDPGRVIAGVVLGTPVVLGVVYVVVMASAWSGVHTH